MPPVDLDRLDLSPRLRRRMRAPEIDSAREVLSFRRLSAAVRGAHLASPKLCEVSAFPLTNVLGREHAVACGEPALGPTALIDAGHDMQTSMPCVAACRARILGG
jgi:hypothetical protein